MRARIGSLSIVVLLLTLAFALGVYAGSAGSGEPPAPPDLTSSYTLEDIYNRLDTGAAGSQDPFTEPVSGPGTGTMHTLDDVMAIAPLADDTNGALPAEVLAGKTFWSLRTNSAWGMQTGTAEAGENVAGPDGSKTFPIPDGLYVGSKQARANDSDLVTGNVRSGVNIFGVAGDPNVVDTASGDAAAADILSGQVAWVDGGKVTGSMPDNGAVTLTPTTTNVAIATGYHDGSGYMQGDADLVAGNIKCGVTIFDVTGSIPQYVAKTGQTASYSAGDDAQYRNGSLPVVAPSAGSSFGGYNRTSFTCSSGFTDNSDGTVTDNLTGLIWLKDANCNGKMAWATALSWANGLYDGCVSCGGTNSDCNLSDGSTAGDWRLPNINELRSLFDSGLSSPYLPADHPFSSVQSNTYWSSTTYEILTSWAWCLLLQVGGVMGDGKTYTYYVWPVRGGQ